MKQNVNNTPNDAIEAQMSCIYSYLEFFCGISKITQNGFGPIFQEIKQGQKSKTRCGNKGRCVEILLMRLPTLEKWLQLDSGGL